MDKFPILCLIVVFFCVPFVVIIPEAFIIIIMFQLGVIVLNELYMNDRRKRIMRKYEKFFKENK